MGGTRLDLNMGSYVINGTHTGSAFNYRGISNWVGSLTGGVWRNFAAPTDGASDRGRNGGSVFNIMRPESTSKISEAKFFNNRASMMGGVIEAQAIGGLLEIENSLFSGNSVQKIEGEVDPGILGNTAMREGGAIFVNMMHLTVKGSTFEYNRAGDMSGPNKGGGGGAVYILVRGKNTVSGGQQTLFDNVKFVENYARTNGGALNYTSEVGGDKDSSLLKIVNSDFAGNTAEKSGGAILLYAFNDGETSQLPVYIAGTSFFSNKAGTYGGAINALDKVKLEMDDVTFSGNKARQFGGAMTSKGILTISNSYFISNETAQDSGGVMSHGGAIFANGDVTLDNVTFAQNKATGIGGALYHAGIGGAHSLKNINFEGNRAAMGGALFTAVAGSRIDAAVFKDNVVDSSAGFVAAGSSFGGAILNMASSLFITDSVFTGNLAQDRGGAIACNTGTANEESILSITAEQTDSLFRGNMEFRGGANPILNSIVINRVPLTDASGSHIKTLDRLDIGARSGREIAFFDPFRNEVDDPSFENLSIDFNKNEGYTGTVRLSGEEADLAIIQETGETEVGWQARLSESKYYNITGQTTLYQGELILEKGVVYGNKDVNAHNSSFIVKNGTLEITGGSELNAAHVAFTSGEVCFRGGTNGSINALDVDFSNGFVFDMQQRMNEADFLPSSGVIVSSDTFRVGGTIGIQDTGIDPNYFYADKRWEESYSFVVLSDGNKIHEGDFDGVKSLALGSDRIDSPYLYTGMWSQEWVDADGDGFSEQLNVVWTPDTKKVIEEILPELAGGQAMNSMWSSASNAHSVSNAALSALGTAQFQNKSANNYWFKGLGDFNYHGSQGTVDGYDYNGGGYALGFDRKITSKAILGLAFGNLYGKLSSRSFIEETRQTSNIGLLYSGWRSEINERNALSITGTAGYGWTTNRMDSFHTSGKSQGKWDNHTGFATVQGQWDHSLQNNWTLNILLGAEYTDVTQKAFTETGWDARRFENGSMKNLSLPIGIGVSKTVTANNMPWRNSLSVSFVPDVYRENPNAEATRLMNGYTWTAKGVSADRQAVRAHFDSSLSISPYWTVYAAYEFEGRSKAIYHRVNLGVSYSY